MMQLDFENWSENEPNDDGEGEDCVEMRGYTWDRGMWNDVSCDTPYLGVICKVDAGKAVLYLCSLNVLE